MKRVLFLSLVLLSVATIVHSCKKESPQDAQVTEIIFKNVDENLNMFVGETFKVRYDIVPEELEDIAQITWHSSKKSVATVEDGIITANKVGRTEITASCGDISASFDVIVEELVVTHFTLPEIVEVSKDNSVQVKVSEIEPAMATVSAIEWSVEDTGLAEAYVENNTLYVRGLQEGETQLIGATEHHTASCPIIIKEYIPLDDIEIVLELHSLGLGQTTTALINYYPENASNKNITWEVIPSGLVQSNEIVQENGEESLELTGIGLGNVTIRAIGADNCTDEVQLEITEPQITSFSLEDPSDGNIYYHICPDGSLRNYNKTVQPTIVTVPEGFEHQLVWSSEDNNIATVDQNGLITATGHGTVLITATAPNGLKESIRVRSLKDSEFNWICIRGMWDYTIRTTFGSVLGYLDLYIIDAAALYESNGETETDYLFFPLADGSCSTKFMDASITVNSNNVSISNDGVFGGNYGIVLEAAIPGDYNFSIDMGAGKIIQNTFTNKINSVTIRHYDLSISNYITDKTISNGSTFTVSKSAYGIEGSNVRAFSMICNAFTYTSELYSESVDDYYEWIYPDGWSSNFGNTQGYQIRITENTPNGTYEFTLDRYSGKLLIPDEFTFYITVKN